MLAMNLPVMLAPADSLLVRAVQAGDRAAFADIVRRHQDTVYRLCLRWLGDEAQAEETAQDVFLAVYRGLPSFRGESSLRTWILRVAVNHCKNARGHRQRRAWGRHDPLVHPDDPARPRDLPDPAPHADARVGEAQLRAHLHAALQDLDEDLRTIVVLRDVEDLDYEEIAQVLELPRGTVKSRLHRARGLLAERLRALLQETP
jgi:RNA polymerase sigma-70 factor (ECF subfamily)